MLQMARSTISPGSPIRDPTLYRRGQFVEALLREDIVRVLPHTKVEELQIRHEKARVSAALRELEEQAATRETLQVIFGIPAAHRRRIAEFVNRVSRSDREIAIPLLLSPDSLENEFVVGPAGSPCLRVILNALPAIDESTPAEELLSFRRDPEATRRRRALLNWQNEIERQNLRPHEIADLLATRVDEYTQHMELRRLRTCKRRVALVVRMIPELIDALTHLKLTKALEALLAFSTLKLDLREAELNAPGRDVAYISYAHEHLGKDKT